MKKVIVVLVALVVAGAVWSAEQTNLSAMISDTYPLAGKCAPINGEVAYRLGSNTPAEVFFGSRGGYVAGYLVAGETVYAVADGPATEGGQWMRATRAVRCGNPTRCRFFVGRPAPQIIEKRVEVSVDRVVEKRVEVPVDRVVEKIVEVPAPSEGTCIAPTTPAPAPAPQLFAVPVVVTSSAPGQTLVVNHAPTQGLIPGLLNVAAAYVGRTQIGATTWNVAGGSATIGNVTSASQSSSQSFADANASAWQQQGQRTHVVASPTTTVGVSTPVSVENNTAVNMPQTTAVNVN